MLAKTPPMGWNSWNTFGADISDAVIREMADAFVALGLDKAGYEYLVIDDCWSEHDRDPETHRIVPSHEKFPNGMKAVADYVHSKGIKFGMYSCAGLRTCANYPGSFDHEFLDARTFAEWGVDFLKYDFCFMPNTANGPLMYRRMGHALRASGREILFSACNWGSHDVWSWIRSAGAHMYRSTGDINDSFESFKNIALSQINRDPVIDWTRPVDELHETLRADGGSCSNAPGCFNDIDMLTVGMFGKGNVANKGCDATDYKTQFALWCFMGAPLMLGADLRNFLKPSFKPMLDLVTNKGLIALDQDEECRPAFRATNQPWGKGPLVLGRLLSGGDIAVGFFNLGENDSRMYLYFETLGIPDAAGINLEMTDVMTGEDFGVKREFVDIVVPKHDCRVFRCKPVSR
jgi:alpha-galactosidase